MSKEQTGFLGRPHDIARLRNAAIPALEFVSSALKPAAVQAFIMDPQAGRLDIASLNLPATLRSIDSELGVFDHGLLHTAVAEVDRSLLVRSEHLEQNRKTSAYLSALKLEGFDEVGEFQFWGSGMFIGGVTLFWNERQPKSIEDKSTLGSLHEFLQFNFLNSWRRTAVGRRQVLGTCLELTPRECDVVEMLCLGRTNQDAALCLGISLPTVKTHLASLFNKFEVENRSALIRSALLNIDTFEPGQLKQ